MLAVALRNSEKKKAEFPLLFYPLGRGSRPLLMAAVSCSAPALAPRLDVATARAVRARIASPLTARGGVAARAVALSCNVGDVGRRPPRAHPASFAAPRRRGAALTPRSTGDAAAASPSPDEGSASVSPPPPRGSRRRLRPRVTRPHGCGCQLPLQARR